MRCNTSPTVKAIQRQPNYGLPFLHLRIIKVVAHCRLHMAKPITAQMFAAIPPGHNNYVVLQTFSFQHA